MSPEAWRLTIDLLRHAVRAGRDVTLSPEFALEVIRLAEKEEAEATAAIAATMNEPLEKVA